MAHIKRNYIDSHWLVFMFQGAIALIFGCLTLFTSQNNSTNLLPIIGIALLAIAVVEFANSLYRSHQRQGWLIATLVALFDAGFGLALILITDQPMVWHLSVLAGYTTLRGIFELLIGFRTTIDPTDRFIWVLCGICGIIFGIAIFNSGHLANVDFIRFFGAYLLIFGIASLIYAIHNRSQKLEDREARIEAAKKSRSAKPARSGRKATQK